jgi:flagellar assembly factor FliW
MIIQSTQFGEFNVAEEQVLKFPEGLPGFPEEKAFAFIPYGDNSPLAILQSVTEPELTFFLVETFVFFPDYAFELDDQLAADYGFSPEHIPQVFSILTVRESIESSTANLAAPVVVNWQTRVAVQVVLERTPYSTRHPLVSGPGAAQRTGGEK